jgi:hypothetical protein
VTDEEYRRKDLVREIVDNPMFDEIIADIKKGLAMAMLETKKEEDRDNLFHEAQALDRFAGQLRRIANEVKVVKNARK